MTRFFISYDRDDRTLTRQLAVQLRRVYGYNEVWFDENIYGGEHWWNEIRQQIATCDIFIFMLSEESAKSPYCEKERVEAVTLHKPVLPVRITNIQEIPDKLREIQYVDMSEGQITVENFTELNAAIRQIAQRIGKRTSEQTGVRRGARSWRRLLVIAPLLVLALLVGLVVTTPQEPFQGELSYVSGSSGISIMQGSFQGVIARLLGRNPFSIAVKVADDSRLAWSPDKSYVAYCDNGDIWIVAADGSGSQNLTNNPADDADPTWSDGQIAFATNRDGNYEIYVMDVSGGNPVNLTNAPGDDRSPAFSRDGSHIAFASNRDGDYEIYVMNRDGSGVIPLTDNNADDLSPVWSPDDLQVAFESSRVRTGGPGSVPGRSTNSGNWDIYLTDVDGSGGANALTRSPGADRHVAYSPDGKQIAFISDRSGSTDLYVKNLLDKGKDILVIEDIQSMAFPSWRS
jgi:dipeptidyl aminopeptidase/acylaminoacyl peptidase